MTFFLTLAAGVDYATARTIALATQYVDDNNSTRPLNISNGHEERLLLYHFTMWEGDQMNPVFDMSTEIANPDTRSTQLRRLLNVSTGAPNDCAKYQFFGEYLHAFEDTVGHRDNTNKPFTVNHGMGHGLNGSEPDFTYDDLADRNDPAIAVRAHFNREARTLEMEREAFAKLTHFGTGGRSFSDFEELMKQFNATRENGSGTADFGQKIKFLQAQLNKWDLKDADGNPVDLLLDTSGGYSPDQAAKNRNKNLCSHGGRLKHVDYPGTILPPSNTPC